MPDKGFFAELADNIRVPQRPQPIIKEQLTTAHEIKVNSAHKSITSLAGSINYQQRTIGEHAQTVYLLIDDTTPAGAEIDPMLGQAYQALTRAAQLLFEAETHLYRYVNRLENDQRTAKEQYELDQFIEHAHNVSPMYDVPEPQAYEDRLARDQ